MNQTYEIDEIITAFETYDGEYKREHVDAALARRDEIIPELIAILENVNANPEYYIYEEANYFAHNYAVLLLGYFKATEAHQTLIELASLPDELPDFLLGDTITEDFSAVLFNTCGGCLEEIKRLVMNRSAYVYCRSAAMQALSFAVVEGLISRDEAFAFLGPLFTGNEASPYSSFWDLLAFTIYDLHPKGMMDVIKWAYQRGLISPRSTTTQEFIDRNELSVEDALADIRMDLKRYTPDDFHKRMEWWACFN